MAGAPTKLTPEVHEKIVQLMRGGVFLKDAAEFSGIGESTARNWKTRGERELESIERGERKKVRRSEKKFVEFAEAITRARAHANVSDLNVMAIAAQEDPYWAERRLRLRNPHWFKEQVDVTSGGKEVQGGVGLTVELASHPGFQRYLDDIEG